MLKRPQTLHSQLRVIVTISEIASIKMRNLIRNASIKLKIQILVKRKRIRRKRKHRQKLKLPNVLLTPIMMIFTPMSSWYAVMMTMTSWMNNSLIMGWSILTGVNPLVPLQLMTGISIIHRSQRILPVFLRAPIAIYSNIRWKCNLAYRIWSDNKKHRQ